MDKYEILSDEYQNHDLSFKVIVIGNSGVGKSCLAIKATKNIFEHNYFATVGFEFFSFNVRFNNDKVIKLQIWDTCGQDIYRSLISNFYRNSMLAIIVYAIDDQKSFDEIDSWLKDLKEHSSPEIKVILIGNKCDLENFRKVPKEKGEQLKEDYGLEMFFETSAKLGTNIEELFVKAAKMLYEEYLKLESKNKKKEINKGVKLNENKSNNKDDNEEQKDKKDKKEKGCC